jgi:cytoskeletal protein CcmA (bactofilin family)
MGRKGKSLGNGVTLVASHTEVIGDIRFTDQLIIDGKITGNVLADEENATVIVSEQGCVAGEIRVPKVVINGLVEGDVHAADTVELAAHGRVRGNLYYNLIEMHLGAAVDGQLLHEVGEPATAQNVHQLSLEAAQE